VVVPAASWPWLLVLRHYLPDAWAELALSGVYVALGLFSFLFTFTVLRDAAWVSLAATAKVASAVAGDGAPGWNAWLANAGAWRPPWLPASSLAVMVLSLAAVGIGAIQAVRPSLVEVTIPVADLAPDLDGLRIAQISDVHLGTLTPDDFLTTVVSRVNALHPDLVAITGDLVDATVAERGGRDSPPRHARRSRLLRDRQPRALLGGRGVGRGIDHGRGDRAPWGSPPRGARPRDRGDRRRRRSRARRR
jgi:hypothetical protein